MNNIKKPGGTRPFGLLSRCLQLGFAMLVLLQPDLALVLSPLVDLLTRAARSAPAPAPAMLGMS